MKKIVIKEIDQFKSKRFKNKTISEYLIYVMCDGTAYSAYTEMGVQNKDVRVNALISQHFMENNDNINLADIIEEYSFTN